MTKHFVEYLTRHDNLTQPQINKPISMIDKQQDQSYKCSAIGNLAEAKNIDEKQLGVLINIVENAPDDKLIIQL